MLLCINSTSVRTNFDTYTGGVASLGQWTWVTNPAHPAIDLAETRARDVSALVVQEHWQLTKLQLPRKPSNALATSNNVYAAKNRKDAKVWRVF